MTTRHYRILLSVSASTYLLWWFSVHLLLPDAFNPFLSRAVVVALFAIALGLSYVSKFLEKHLRTCFHVLVWVLTCHYFYLFHHNSSDPNWIIGSYITVIAVAYTLQTAGALLSYTALCLALSTVLTALDPSLHFKSVFLPGIATVLILANIGFRSKRLLEAAREGIRGRDEFLMIASHELKTPLTILKLQSQMALRKGPKDAEKFAHEIDRQTNRLIRLVDGMLEVSQIRNRQLVLDKEWMDLEITVKSALKDLSKDFHSLHYDVRVESEGPVSVFADKVRLRLVLVHLLENAIKYGNHQPIEVKLSTTADEARIRVIDHGMGIPEKEIDRIFQPFERAVSGRYISGLGLGLFIVRRVVELHHGTLEVMSHAGQGSTFVIKLPRARPLTNPLADRQDQCS